MTSAQAVAAALSQPRSTIAVVGLSPNPQRPSNEVARYLLAEGSRVIPVHPQHQEILGQTCYPELGAIPEPGDIVDVFRRAEDCPPIATQAVANSPSFGSPSFIRTTITPAAGVLAANAYAVEVDFTTPPGVPNGHSGYCEISVFGSPSLSAVTLPESPCCLPVKRVA